MVSVGEKAGSTCQVWITETNESEPLMRHLKDISTVAVSRAQDEPSECLMIGWARRPVYMRRDGFPGLVIERGNLFSRCQGSRPRDNHPEVSSTDARRRGGVIRSSDEAAVMAVERRGHVIGSWALRQAYIRRIQ
ncbi:hypothetical protein CKO08_12280 [Halorhodospira halochloris]|nr:hypothetical protein [Halorhodospira halochloris]